MGPWTNKTPTYPTGKLFLTNLREMSNKVLEKGGKLGVKGDNWFGDIGSGFVDKTTGDHRCPAPMKDIVPCLARTRCGSGGHWSFSRQRFLNLTELFRLMSIPDNRITIPQTLSERKVKLMIGNAFDVGLIQRIMYRLLSASGILPARTVGLDPRGTTTEDSGTTTEDSD